MSVHQAAEPPACELTIAPTTATPSVWPNCREVVAIADATPAWARGIPDTAAFVIGALTKPKPIPKITYAAISHPNGVCASMPVSIALAVTRQTPEIRSGRRGPRRPTRRPDSGDASTVMTASGTVASPAWSGESPRASCRYSVLRNRKPPNAAKAATEMTIDDENGSDRKKRRSTRGSAPAGLVAEQARERQRRRREHGEDDR